MINTGKLMSIMCVLSACFGALVLVITKHSTLCGIPFTKTAIRKFKEDKNCIKDDETLKFIHLKNVFLIVVTIVMLIFSVLFNRYESLFILCSYLLFLTFVVFYQKKLDSKCSSLKKT